LIYVISYRILEHHTESGVIKTLLFLQTTSC